MPNAAPASPSGSPLRSLTALRRRLVHIYNREIWQSAFLRDRTPRGLLYAFLRVVSISITVFLETRVTSRAAALSFSSLLGLGPLIAIAVLVGGFVLGDKGDEVISDKIGRVIELVAPQLSLEARHSEARAAGTTAAAPTPDPSRAAAQPATPAPAPASAVPPPAPNAPTTLAPAPTPADSSTPAPALNAHTPTAPPGHQAIAKRVNPDIVHFVRGIITAARSSSGGAFGAISLIMIVLLLFKTIEDAFNDIWGVRVGRSIIVRIVFYWTILTLGAVIFFAAITLLGAGTFINVFEPMFRDLPGGHELLRMLKWSLPLFSMTLLVALLTIVYRVIPNTRVFWAAAFLGALVVTGLLLLNNYAGMLYVRRVILTRSLYGSVALPLVLLFALYFFWLYLLIGGIVSYAVQNVQFRNSQAAWSTLPENTRERLTLVVFLTICRRFRECLPPISASDLSVMLKVPTQLVNECLGRLEKLELVMPVLPKTDQTEPDTCYQPARPLNRITLHEFKTRDDSFGENLVGSSLDHIDPIIAHYDAALNRLSENELFQKSLDDLFAEYKFDDSRPPFTLGSRPAENPPSA
ncbi:YihY/virulence factor BrkB family protein [Opitutus sp. ER46]|uniref:YihY/virulence factor BrkB family protein n=1 Tax=Opitutus sp. ER46 TaxID=2161864 RepID=UPI000D30E9F8|nr:YihY/virulence factor BrkB family protein [Opitutus sp. ER46]PTY00317.1 hypothetical protein DB354_01515 [Opitutus sp. ER46]